MIKRTKYHNFRRFLMLQIYDNLRNIFILYAISVVYLKFVHKRFNEFSLFLNKKVLGF